VITNVCNVQWCKSHYGLVYKTKQIFGIVEKIEYIRKTDTGPVQYYIRASFDFGYNDVKSNKIRLSQLKVFIENEQPNDPPNASIASHAGTVVEINVYALNEAQPCDNGNNDIIEGEHDKRSDNAGITTTATNSPPTNSTNLFDINVASPPCQQQQ
jgi:hypothetical protein